MVESENVTLLTSDTLEMDSDCVSYGSSDYEDGEVSVSDEEESSASKII